MIKEMAKVFKAEGVDCYYVGGCVRDKLMGNKCDDIDICLVNTKSIEQVEHILSRFTQQFVKEVGKAFPVWIITIDGQKYDVALARTEKKVGDYRTEFLCNTENVTIEDDLKRRDLTINSIAENILTGEMVDPFNGINHIKHCILHHTSEAFSEDSLRVLRTARFISRFIEFEPTQELLDICRKLEPTDISPERVGKELMKTFEQAVKPSLFFTFLFSVNWLRYYFKELEDLVYIRQSPIYHPEGSAFTHTMHCLDVTKQGDWFTRAVMLCHDLGKSTTTIVHDDGKITSVGHEEASVAMTDSLLKRIHFTDHRTIGQIKMLVRLHMITTITISEKVVRRTLRKLMECHLSYEQLVEVCRCDKSGRPPLPAHTPDIGQERAKELIKTGVMIPVVTGKTLIAEGFTNYLEFGAIIEKALELQDRGILDISNWKQRLKEAKLI